MMKNNKLLYCECKNLASSTCSELKCVNCCVDVNCHRHKNKVKVKKIKNKNTLKNAKNTKKTENIQDYNYECNCDYEYDCNELTKIKFILNKILIDDITNYIVDNFIDNRNSCAICNNKRIAEDLYPCYYCNKLVCDDNCNECKISTIDNDRLIYYCIGCKNDGVVSEDGFDLNFTQSMNYNQDTELNDESDNESYISIESLSSTISIENIDINQLILDQTKCNCGKIAKYCLRQIDKIPRCWSCKNILWYDNHHSTYYLCNLDCKQGIYIDSVEKVNDRVEISSFIDKDECSYCGKRNMTSNIYNAIKFIDENDNLGERCKCGKLIRYKLYCQNSIYCINCSDVIYSNYLLDLCSTLCEWQHEFKISQYLCKNKKVKNNIDIDVKFEFSKKNHICTNCNYVQDITEIFEGKKICQNIQNYDQYFR